MNLSKKNHKRSDPLFQDLVRLDKVIGLEDEAVQIDQNLVKEDLWAGHEQEVDQFKLVPHVVKIEELQLKQ